MKQDPAPYDGGPISTIYDALDEKQRKKLDNAIVTRNPSSLTKVHEIFHLAEKGISQQTLYRYARKIRDQANKLTLMESTFTSEVDIVEHLKNQIGRQCMDMILNADVNGITPLDTQRIANAFGKCLQFDLVIARTKAINQKTDAAPVAACAPAGHGHESPLETRETRETPRPTRQELEVGNDPDAPHGRNEDGSPRTHEQYCATVKKVLFEVYASKSVKEAAAREAAEKAAAAKQDPDNPLLVRESARQDLAPTFDGQRVAEETIPSVPFAASDSISRIIRPSRKQNDFPGMYSDLKVAER